MNKRILSKIPLLNAGKSLMNTAERMKESNIRYFVVGRITNAAKKKTLILHFYLRTQLESGDTKAEFRTFLTKNDYITQRLDCEGIKWLTGSLDTIIPSYNSHGYVGRWTSATYIADGKTIAAIRYFADEKKPPLEALEKYQYAIKNARLAKKHKVITDRIDAKMALVQDTPADFEDWLDKTGFGQKRYIFYSYKKGRNKQDGYCTACHSPVRIEKPRHKKSGVCPSCGREVSYMVTGKSKRVCDSIQTAVFQKTSEGFVVRYIWVSRKYEDFKRPVFNLFEERRNFYENDNHEPYYYGKFRQTSQYRWCENTRYGRGMGNPWDPYAVTYDRNLREILADTEWKYSAIWQYATRHDGAYVDVHGYLSNYLKHPCLEYLVKLKLYNLAGYFACYGNVKGLNKNGKNVTEILGVKKAYIKIMQEMDIPAENIELMQAFSQMEIPVTPKCFRGIIELYGLYDAVNAVLLSKYASFERIESYCKKRAGAKNSFKSIFVLWRDYIKSCEQLPEYDLTNDFVVFPRHLRKAHDAADQRVQAKKNAANIAKFEEITKNHIEYLAELQEKYRFEDDKYEIMAPSDFADIIREGYTLRHCVGGYAENAAAKKTIILFVRLKKNRSVPFYTMEIQNDTIHQCRGKRNCGMTDGLKKFVESFKQKILQAA